VVVDSKGETGGRDEDEALMAVEPERFNLEELVLLPPLRSKSPNDMLTR
jgi:hypothetical protein